MRQISIAYVGVSSYTSNRHSRRHLVGTTNRGHTVAAVQKSFELAKDAGFKLLLKGLSDVLLGQQQLLKLIGANLLLHVVAFVDGQLALQRGLGLFCRLRRRGSGG